MTKSDDNSRYDPTHPYANEQGYVQTHESGWKVSDLGSALFSHGGGGGQTQSAWSTPGTQAGSSWETARPGTGAVASRPRRPTSSALSSTNVQPTWGARTPSVGPTVPATGGPTNTAGQTRQQMVEAKRRETGAYGAGGWAATGGPAVSSQTYLGSMGASLTSPSGPVTKRAGTPAAFTESTGSRSTNNAQRRVTNAGPFTGGQVARASAGPFTGGQAPQGQSAAACYRQRTTGTAAVPTLSPAGTTAKSRAADPMNWRGIARSLGNKGNANFSQYRGAMATPGVRQAERGTPSKPVKQPSNLAKVQAAQARAPKRAPSKSRSTAR